MKETTIKKYTCDYCGFMTIVHGDGIFTGNTKEQAQEHEDNCYYNPTHKKCATCVHMATSHLSNIGVCILRTNEAENKDNGLFIPMCAGDSCSMWALSNRPTPWYDRKNTLESRFVEQSKKSGIYTGARYYHIAFVSNTLNENLKHDVNVCVYVPDGLSEGQANKLDESFSQYIEDRENKHDGDYSKFSYHDAIRDSFSVIGVQYEYPEADYTIHM